MKFLIIHNEYSRRGGEESVVAQQCKLLRSNGHTVIEYSRRHGEVSKIGSFFTALFNSKSVRDIRRIIESEKPDAAIIHNLFPVISAAILPVLKKAGVRVVMTLHNFRLVCPNGLFYTHGSVCERCGTSPLGMVNCALRKCEGSAAGSLAWSVRSLWAKSYFKSVDKFMALSDFQRSKITQYSDLDVAKFEIVPNFVGDMPTSELTPTDYIGFVGRLSEEKGVKLLFETARLLPSHKFRVAGERAENCSTDNIPPNVELVGMLDKQQLADFYSAARYIILTSSCYEGLPLTVLEAMYYRATVIVPRWAALPEMVGDAGVFYTPNDAEDLARRITENHNTGEAAHQRVTEKYNAVQYYNNIMRCV